MPEGSRDKHVDHIEPKSRGGSDHADNLIIACQKCNLMKSNLYTDEFVYKLLEKLRVTIDVSVRNKNKVVTSIRRHGESDKQTIRLVSHQSDFDGEVGMLSKMIGNVIKYL